MDGSKFDRMTKTLASTSRRSLLKAGLGSAIGLALSGIGVNGTRAAQAFRQPGEICRKAADCASGLCGPKDRTGRSRCLCLTFADCPPLTDGGVCDIGTCNAGVCETAINVGASCGTGDLCTTNPVCQPDGSCAGTPVDCAAPHQCQEEGICDPQTGLCSYANKQDGTPCVTGVPNSSGATCQSSTCTCTPNGTNCGTKQCGMGLTSCGQPVSCGDCDPGDSCDQNGMCVAN